MATGAGSTLRWKAKISSQKQFELDRDLIARGEKPSVFLDFPVDVTDSELMDLFSGLEYSRGHVGEAI